MTHVHITSLTFKHLLAAAQPLQRREESCDTHTKKQTASASQNDQIMVHLGDPGIIDGTWYRGRNYGTNTIIIVCLAILALGAS